MIRRILSIALAFVGLSVGAGFASGREVMQFFVAFGTAGIWGAGLVALTMCLVGYVVLQLGSYYQAQEHAAVYDEVMHPVTARILDASTMLTVFSIGLVMFAGAGANLNQQFGIPVWIGAVFLLALVLISGRADIDKVSSIIAYTTPLSILLIIIAAIYAVTHTDQTWDQLDAQASGIATSLPNVIVSAVNYAGFSLIVVVSMSIVIGGYYLSPRVAGLGGLLGGFLFGGMLFLVALTLFLQSEGLGDEAMPMLTIVSRISPALGLLMALSIFAMIFNSALGMFYAFSRRMTSKKPERFYTFFVASSVAGFIVSFLGFKNLVAYLFPALGYIGMVLTVLLFVAWAKDRATIMKEDKRRGRILRATKVLVRGRRPLSEKRRQRMVRDLHESNIADEDLKADIRRRIREGDEL